MVAWSHSAGSIHDVLEVVLANLRVNRKGPWVTWLRHAGARVWRPIDQFNARARARRNVAHHYDLNGRLYSLFLDRDRHYGATVTGITLSTEQLAEAQARSEAEGLADRVSFQLLDYRAVDQRFDRIVSVGMFEHVGVFHYRVFFDTVSRCLKPDGVALLHSIGQWDGPGINNPWIKSRARVSAMPPQPQPMSTVLPGAQRGDA
jgi:cyclopropane-fatty-acyl-phospholipid synthase